MAEGGGGLTSGPPQLKKSLEVLVQKLYRVIRVYKRGETVIQQWFFPRIALQVHIYTEIPLQRNQLNRKCWQTSEAY